MPGLVLDCQKLVEDGDQDYMVPVVVKQMM